MSEQRPKGVIGEWYTLTSKFKGFGKTADRKPGYTWQCEELDADGEPMIDGVYISSNESYRLATAEEIVRANGEEPHPSKPSKEAREFWERAFFDFSQRPNYAATDCVEIADFVMAEWQKRFEQ